MLSDPSAERAEEALEAASQILWSLSGQRYSGTHAITETYDVRYFSDSLYYPTVLPSEWQSWRCLQCGHPHRLRLRNTPVRSLTHVSINGSSVLPSDYVLIDHASVGFAPGASCAAYCVEVSYVWGSNPPISGKAAAVTLANEFLLSWDNSSECRLPQRVTNVTRQGVSWTILDPQDFLNQGRTGIYEVDLFLRSINPSQAVKRARVFSPDVPRASVVTELEPPPLLDATPSDLVLLSKGSSGWYTASGASWPVGSVPVAKINGDDAYGSTMFTQNPDGSWVLSLSPDDTWELTDGDTFSVVARPVSGPDVVRSSGYVRFVS